MNADLESQPSEEKQHVAFLELCYLAAKQLPFRHLFLAISQEEH